MASYKNTANVTNQKVTNETIRFICFEDTSNLALYWKQAEIIIYILTCSFLFIIYFYTKEEQVFYSLSSMFFYLNPSG